MIHLVEGPLISQPEQWILAFEPAMPGHPWLNRLVPGRFKHVRAFGKVPFLHVWLFFDATLAGLELRVAADGRAADTLAVEWTRSCTIMVMPKRPHANRSALLAASGWCVPSVKRLIGLQSSALRPDALFADCLANGGKLYGQRLLTPDTTRSGRAAGDAAGAGGHATA